MATESSIQSFREISSFKLPLTETPTSCDLVCLHRHLTGPETRVGLPLYPHVSFFKSIGEPLSDSVLLSFYVLLHILQKGFFSARQDVPIEDFELPIGKANGEDRAGSRCLTQHVDAL